MMSNERLKENLEVIQRQIEKFDNKASILIAIVSIVFAISLEPLNMFQQIFVQDMTHKIFIKYILAIVFLCLYFISFVLEMLFLILVIFPRKKKKSGCQSLSYYLDVSKMTKEEIEKQCSITDESAIIIDQLSVNAKICAKKHKNFVIAIWLMIPLVLFMISLTFLSII